MIARPKNSYSRRSFLKDVGLASGYLLLLNTGCNLDDILAQINSRPMRMKLPNASTPAGSKVFDDLLIYKQAVAAMKALPASDKRSWQAQSLLHGSNSSSSFTFCQHNTLHFVSWHRAYLWQFEEICRELTGEEEFGLPYWNWAMDKNVASAFLDPAPNPLLDSRTNTNVLGAASNFTYSTLNTIFQGQFVTFSNSLEGQPHNNAHVQIGQNMVSYQSPLDPLFWTHHCMVDYCWYDWNIIRNNPNPNANVWQQESWNHFVARDGSPATFNALQTVLMPIFNYQYEHSAITQAPLPSAPKSIASLKFKKLEDYEALKRKLEAGGKVNFAVGQTFRLEQPVQKRKRGEIMLPSTLPASQIENIKFDQKLRNRRYVKVHFPTPPETNDFFVEVYMNPGEIDALTESAASYAGSFAFFGTNDREENQARSFYVDITDTFINLKQKGGLKSDDNLNFVLKMVKLEQSEQNEDYLETANLSVVVSDPFIEEK